MTCRADSAQSTPPGSSGLSPDPTIELTASSRAGLMTSIASERPHADPSQPPTMLSERAVRIEQAERNEQGACSDDVGKSKHRGARIPRCRALVTPPGCSASHEPAYRVCLVDRDEPGDRTARPLVDVPRQLRFAASVPT